MFFMLPNSFFQRQEGQVWTLKNDAGQIYQDWEYLFPLWSCQVLLGSGLMLMWNPTQQPRKAIKLNMQKTKIMASGPITSWKYPPESIFHTVFWWANAPWRSRGPEFYTNSYSIDFSPLFSHQTSYFSWKLSILTRNWNNGQYRHQRRKWRWLKKCGEIWHFLPKSDSVILKIASVLIFTS